MRERTRTPEPFSLHVACRPLGVHATGMPRANPVSPRARPASERVGIPCWAGLALLFSLLLASIPARAEAGGARDGYTEAVADATREVEPAGQPTSRDGLVLGSSIGLSVGVGYGLPLGPARGSDLEDVRYVALFPSWSTGLAHELGGTTWYRGNLDLTIEGALLANRQPTTGYAAGGTALLHYEFLGRGRLVPYVELGVGFVFVDFDLDRQHDGFNFTPQAGIGIKLPLTEEMAVTAGWRFHHISNANLRSPNTGLDDSLVLIGFRYSLGR